MWQFVSIVELRDVIISTMAGTLINDLITVFMELEMLRSWFVIYWLLLAVLVADPLFSYSSINSGVTRGKQ